MKEEVLKFKDYDKQINRELVTKPWEYVERKIEENKSEIKSYLKTQKVLNADTQRKIIKLEIDISTLQGRITMLEKHSPNENMKNVKTVLNEHTEKLRALIKDVCGLRDTININYEYWSKQNDILSYEIENKNTAILSKMSIFENENKMVTRELDRYHSLYRDLSKSAIDYPNSTENSNYSRNKTKLSIFEDK